MIKDYITKIEGRKELKEDGTVTIKTIFHGDGVGDNEQTSEEATFEVIQKYARYCEGQINLTNSELLRIFYAGHPST